ncbi:MAG: methylase [Planctomycetota bacterium]|nr:methylase [Planctomycetota bacterium]
MLDANEQDVLARIRPGDVVLDIGGWARCFNRANYVLDLFPYETRGRCYKDAMDLGPQGGPVEHFSAETWICRDLCDHTPWPFADKSIDFCTCSHTLEDLRDPLWLCHEMIRVAKRGYIEVPSMAFELSRGREPGVPVGLSHHKWIVDVTGSGVTFIPKLHFVHGERHLSLPAKFGGSLPPDRLVSWLFWEDGFTYAEGWFTREQLAETVRSFGAETEDGEDSLERDRLELVLAQTQRELSEARAREHALRQELAYFAGLGPRSVRVARKIHTFSQNHPTISRLLQKGISTARD